MHISNEAYRECLQQSLHRKTCLRKARWFCRGYCDRFPGADKCATHCTDAAEDGYDDDDSCREVCRPSGRCELECDDPEVEAALEDLGDGPLRIQYRPNIPLLVHRNVYGRGWKFNALPIQEYQYGNITGTSVDSIWAQGDTLEVVRRRA